jgi:glycosyltransferase involved in cell wall biosynthesis
MHATATHSADTLVVVPTYNEVENLRPLAEKLLGLPVAVEVVCVDDSSPDGTGALADELADEHTGFHVIHRSEDRGYAPSSRAGMKWGLENGYANVCTMDADLSHDPEVLPGMLEHIAAGSDLVIGSRFVPGGELQVDWGPVRRAVSKVGSRYARAMIGTSVRDCTSGYRCYRASALARIDFAELYSDGYSFLIEMLAAFSRNGFVIEEVPITYVDRLRGSSKISRSIVYEALLETTRLGIRRLTGSR